MWQNQLHNLWSKVSPQEPVIKALFLLNVHTSSVCKHPVMDLHKDEGKNSAGFTTFAEET